MAFQSSQTLLELINFLTRPLTKVYPVLTVMYHRQVLQKQLHSSFFSHTTTSTPFTLILSPALLPPMPIYAACLMSGVQWVEWVNVLAPQGMCVFVTEGLIKIKTAEQAELTTAWSKADRSSTPSRVPATQDGSSTPSTSLSQLRTALRSVQSRNANAAITKPLSKPRISVSTDIVAIAGRHTSPRTPFRPQPSRLSQVITLSDDEDEEEEDSDSESDAGSTTSSSSSVFSSAGSVSSSATSLASSDCGSPCSPFPQSELNLDRLRSAIKSRLTIRTSNVSVPQRPSPVQSRKAERDERRFVDSAKIDVVQYKYKGGQTAVMTGGVMLGAVRPKKRC